MARIEITAGGKTVFGTQSSDTILTVAADTIGNDTIFGRGGNDTVFAGAGNDRIFGGTGDDIMNGEGGNDTIAVETN